MKLKGLTSKKNLVVFLITVILTGGALYRFRDRFIVAIVNGQPISRLTLIKELERQAGKNALERLITQTLILQEAGKQSVTVSDEEINQEIKQLEEGLAAQGQDLNQLLNLQGMTQNELKEEIRIQKIAEKIVKKDIEVTDEEVENYFAENKDSFPEDANTEEIKKDIKQQLEQRKLDDGINMWVESLHDSAKITYL